MVTAEQPSSAAVTTAAAGGPLGTAAAASSGTAHHRAGLRDVALMLTAAGSTQTGAAFGAHAFPMIGPAGVVAVRQLVASAVLLPVARPNVRAMRWAQWWPVLGLTAIFAVMNLAVYTTVDRIGLALAITLEFLGPLGVALAGSRSVRHLLTALAVAGGVYVLVLPGPSSDYVGVAIGLFSACCWAAYIMINRVLGARLPGVAGTALASSISATGYLPFLVLLIVSGRMTWAALGFAMTAGALASAVPYALDLIALRTVSPQVFGIVMSAHPVMAALAGMAILGQLLAWHEWLGIAIITAANTYTVLSSHPS